LEGHFILTSGLRSPVFLQKARVFMYPDRTERLCKALAEKIRAEAGGDIDYVVGPAVGGIIPAYETSRHLGAPAIWVEREDGVFRLRRFEIKPGARVVIVEDIVTTGLSIRETIDCMRNIGAEVVAAACIVDRSAGKVDVGVPLIALAQYEVPAYKPDEIPPELAAIPPIKPGSRNL
jgi:orotate phosphoribosyltransferase